LLRNRFSHSMTTAAVSTLEKCILKKDHPHGSPKIVGDASVVVNNTEKSKAPSWVNHLESPHVVILCCRKSDVLLGGRILILHGF
jgi:hypothetical protein